MFIGLSLLSMAAVSLSSAAPFLKARDFYETKRSYSREVRPEEKWLNLFNQYETIYGDTEIRGNWRFLMLRDSQCRKENQRRRCRLYSGIAGPLGY